MRAPDHSSSAQAARQLVHAWAAGDHIRDLSGACRPQDIADGYAIQALWPAVLDQPVAGWKIAATSEAGQKHIAVSGPLAGPVFGHRVHSPGVPISLEHNRMRVAECEVVFHFAQSLIPRPYSYSRSEVLAALAAVGPGIEVPDSRFLHFECAGAAQLTADCACTNDMVLGTPVALDARLEQLAGLSVRAEVSDGRIATGSGRNVMGDPVEALVWLVNELGRAGQTLGAGQFVTTGACVAPIPVVPGDQVQADFGWLGALQAGFR